MNLLGPVSDLMTARLYTLSEHATIEDAKTIFDNYRIHHIPIVEGGKLLGLVSKSDLLGFLSGLDNKKKIGYTDAIKMKAIPVSQIMTSGIATMESTDRINVALEILKENLFHAVPIVDNGELVGIVTTLDIIKRLSEDKEAHSSYE